MVRRWSVKPAWLSMLAACAVLLLAESAFAQGTIRGVVTDEAGTPIAGATVVLEAQAQSRRLEAKTNARGEYVQIGLASGAYLVHAEQGTLKAAPAKLALRAGQTVVSNFVLGARAAMMSADAATAAAARAAEVARLFEEGAAASTAQRWDEALERFNQALQLNPNCFDCLNNIGYVHSQRKAFDQAEAAYRQSTLVKADDPVAYNGLATVYNALRRFDEAAAASQRAAELSGGGAAAGGGDATALYNQGVILWNGGKVADAKAAFQSAIAADPNHADAHYQFGMVLVNEGNLEGAASEFDTYLKLAPSGAHAPTAKALLSQLRP